jgi:hypothetical protein
MIGQFHETLKLRKLSMANVILSAILARSLRGIGGLRLGGYDHRAGEIFLANLHVWWVGDYLLALFSPDSTSQR